MMNRLNDVVGAYLLAAVVLAAAAALLGVGCGDEPPTFSNDVDTGVAIVQQPDDPAAPSPQGEVRNGVLVEVLVDDWGPGSCHKNGGLRRFRLTNNRQVEIYSNLSAFTDDKITCATQETPTGNPEMIGPTHIAAGASGIVTYYISMPDGKEGVCTLQVDDCWGPGGLRECSFVVGDSFVASRCEEKPKCEDLFGYHVRNREQQTTTYTFSNGHQLRLRHGEVGSLGPTNLTQASVSWRDASGKHRTYDFSADQCGGDFRKACHSEFFVTCDCVLP